MKERKLKRRHLIYYLQVEDIQTGTTVGHVVDITTEGLKLVSEKALDPGLNFHLRMRLPMEDDENREITFKAVSRWTEKDVNPAFFLTGFSMEISDEDQRAINHLVEEFGFQD